MRCHKALETITLESAPTAVISAQCISKNNPNRYPFNSCGKCRLMSCFMTLVPWRTRTADPVIHSTTTYPLDHNAFTVSNTNGRCFFNLLTPDRADHTQSIKTPLYTRFLDHTCLQYLYLTETPGIYTFLLILICGNFLLK